MCGRVFVKTSLAGLMSAFPFVPPGDVEPIGNTYPRWNGAPGQDYPIIISDVVREPDIRGMVFARALWGFVPRWSKSLGGGDRRPPINARCEGIATSGMFKDAYRRRRALMPIDGYFEWQDIHGTGKNKQPYAIALKSGEPFAIAAIWETWRDPETGLETRTFAAVTCEPNELVATIHDRMPVILHPDDYERWLGAEEDPRELMKPFPANQMTMWKIGRQVGAYKNNTPDILDPLPEEKPKANPEDEQPTLF